MHVQRLQAFVDHRLDVQVLRASKVVKAAAAAYGESDEQDAEGTPVPRMPVDDGCRGARTSKAQSNQSLISYMH